MKEYIEREAASQAWRGYLRSLVDGEDVYEDSMKNVLEEIPTADVVEVVRCGECKHRDEKTGWCEDVQDYISNTNWFCAGGERKDGADDDDN